MLVTRVGDAFVVCDDPQLICMWFLLVTADVEKFGARAAGEAGIESVPWSANEFHDGRQIRQNAEFSESVHQKSVNLNDRL